MPQLQNKKDKSLLFRGPLCQGPRQSSTPDLASPGLWYTVIIQINTSLQFYEIIETPGGYRKR